MKKVNVDHDFEFVLVSSMRYAIGRRSYAPHLIAEYIKKQWDNISDNCRFLLQRDLQYEINQADKYITSQIMDSQKSGCGGYSDNENCSFQKRRSEFTPYDSLGHECDRTTWINLNAWMIERIKK